jgi:acetyl-CoA C-acetyltransferase
MSGGQFVGQEHLGPLMADHLGMRGVPAMRVESACASGGMALRAAWIEVASGASDLVLAAGVEKMNDGADVTGVLATAARTRRARSTTASPSPGLYAMIARAHMAAHGTTLEDMSWVSVKNHRHGALNPKAQFRREVTVDEVMGSSMVADPAAAAHCSPVSDGAAAVLLVPPGPGPGVHRPARPHPGERPWPPRPGAGRPQGPRLLDAVRCPPKRAYDMAGWAIGHRRGRGPRLLLHRRDLLHRGLGFTDGRERGPGRARSGYTALGGRIPSTPAGGSSRRATRWAPPASPRPSRSSSSSGARRASARCGRPVGLTQNMGGSGASSVVHVLERA